MRARLGGAEGECGDRRQGTRRRYYLVSGCLRLLAGGVNVLFTVEVWTYNHVMGSSVLAQTIVNITQLDGGALRQRLDRLNNDV